VIVREIHAVEILEIILETILSLQTEVKINTGILTWFCTKLLSPHTRHWWRFIFTLLF